MKCKLCHPLPCQAPWHDAAVSAHEQLRKESQPWREALALALEKAKKTAVVRRKNNPVTSASHANRYSKSVK